MTAASYPTEENTAAAAGPGMTVRLGAQSWRFAPGQEVRIGRALDCAVVVADPAVSRHHASLQFDNGWRLVDPGSANGVWIDGRRLRDPQLVQTAVTLRLGSDPSAAELRLLPDGARAAYTKPVASGTITVGRDLGNDIVLADALASRHHFQVEMGPGGLTLVDLGSRNRTFVNGVPVTRCALAEGDRVAVGNTDLLVRDGRLVALPARAGRLVASGAGYVAPNGRRLLSGVDLDAGPGSLIAIIGPSGAGKSTLMRVLTGELPASGGEVTYDGRDVHAERALLASRIGYVPQDDIVHSNLTAIQALTYAARLRLPEDTAPDELAERVRQVIDELSLTRCAHRRINASSGREKLSGGERKRVSVALELLTRPPLLVLDEPTSGLDPHGDKEVMTTLRRLADAGRIVVVVTHNVMHLDGCDRVVMVAAGGVIRFNGPPAKLLAHLGVASWPEAYALASKPKDGHRAEQGRVDTPRQLAPRPTAAPRRTTARTRLRQMRTLAARHVRLIAADRPYALILLALPMVLAGLALTVPGSAGLGPPGENPTSEAGHLLVLLVVGAAFMGASASAREVIGERAILRREIAAGLDVVAYVLAKALVFSVVVALQSVVLTAGVLLVKPRPPNGVMLSSGALELYVAVAVTALGSCALGLLASAVVRSADQVMPLLAAIVMTELVLCGGLIPVTGRPALEVVAAAMPSRWGFAAAASTTDLTVLQPNAPRDGLWAHDGPVWAFDVALAAILAVAVIAVTGATLARAGRSSARRGR